MECLRCEVIGREPGVGRHKALMGGGEYLICDDCLEELDAFTYIPNTVYEDEED
jgi:hypothetical protein